jgi:TonB family protein
MMKLLTLLTLFVTCFGIVHAQKKQNIYFIKKNGKFADSKDSADYIRVIQEPDSGSSNFILIEQYIDGRPKTVGTLSSFDPILIYEGQLLRYGKTGKKESLIDYRKGKVIGKAYFFFEDGRLHKILEYEDVKVDFDPFRPSFYDQKTPFHKLEYYADSTGTIMVDKGKGHIRKSNKSVKEEMIEEGDYLDGLKDGLWTETNASNTYWVREKFLKGKFLSGESFKDGQTHIYAIQDELPTYRGGMEQFYRYLSGSVRYPADAQKYGITGKVYTSFVVEKDGSLAEVKVTRGLGYSLDDEAIRVLRQSPRWIPGKQRGIPVRVKYNLPISFTLH